MSAATASTDPRPAPRFVVTPALELLVLGIAVAIAIGTYFTITGRSSSDELLSPPLVAVLLVANLVPSIALLMLLGRRIALKHARSSSIGGGGRLHVRLVAVFSLLAAVPVLLVTIFASLLLQNGVEFWSSARAQALLGNSRELVRQNYQREIDGVVSQAEAMSQDVAKELATSATTSKRFTDFLFYQTYIREMSEAMIVRRNERDPLAVLSPYGRPLENLVTPRMMDSIRNGKRYVVIEGADRIGVLVPLAYGDQSYLYTSKIFEAQLAEQMRRSDAIAKDYLALRSRAQSLQLRFNAALLGISLLIVGIAVWIALAVADRLVRPVDELVAAARAVEGGDLATRVPDPRRDDEVGTLAKAFNSMTGRLQVQNTELVTANEQLETRRALIEAVMGGVSAGVLATAADGTIRIANQSATRLLGTAAEGLTGRRLADVAPDLAAMIEAQSREAIVQIGGVGEARTLAVRITYADAGPILTFDDITQQVLDQRRAAWSDVARRIAHEIKNPLTPIQLAAERLQRRYGGKVDDGDTTFARLTETIVRQVGDLRRMVDEFSSFARMPKPVFRTESLVDTARQSLFLHEVAHPGVRFELVHDEPGPVMVFDRRQIGQALTNIVKNAVEAIEAKGDDDDGDRAVVMTLAEQPGRAIVTVEDTGVGLPAERDRIVEPYMTTRARGTGLGLAIVKKIVEEHHGTIIFSDRSGGGTTVTMSFDTVALADRDEGSDTELDGEGQLATLTRTGNAS